VVSTQWTGAVPPCTGPTGVEKSDPVKWLAPTGAKPMGHDDDDDPPEIISSPILYSNNY
jgi:hypothetical protein